MTLRPFLPAAAILSGLAAATIAYRLAWPADPTPPPRPDNCNFRLPADPAAEAAYVRSVARDLVALEVIAGRTSVPEAAAVFDRLDALPPRCPAAPDGYFVATAGLPDRGGYTAAELLGVRVVAQVALNASADRPGGADRVRREFLAARARGAFARLPAAPECRFVQLVERARAEAARSARGRLGMAIASCE